jgi:hypothetical protein
MFTAKQYRAKAAEYRGLLAVPRSPAEASEFRNLEQTYTTLADNEEWLELNAGKIMHASDYDIVPTLEDEQNKRGMRIKDDERILRCLATWGYERARRDQSGEPPCGPALRTSEQA